MAGLEPASVEVVAALQGDTPDNDHELVPNYPAPDHQLGSNISSLAAAKRRQHRRQFLRRTIVRPPIASALPSLPAPLPRVSFGLFFFFSFFFLKGEFCSL